MHNKVSPITIPSSFATDTFEWFQSKRHGHMGKWQYLEQKHPNDACCAQQLWDKWENSTTNENMLKRQHKIIQSYAHEFSEIAPKAKTLIDLGPGGKEAVLNNTLPVVSAYESTLSTYYAIDINAEFANDAANTVRQHAEIDAHALPYDFTQPIASIIQKTPTVGLFSGGTIGNFEAEPNTPHAIKLMSRRILEIKHNIPSGSYVFIGLECTQETDTIYGDYDHPAHAEFEINIMHGIKRDLLADQDGFDAFGWKYEMKWWPESFQFCHIAEATTDHNFSMLGEKFYLPKGTQLIIDNSFKFPALAMMRAVQLAKCEYIKTFYDSGNRMAMHAIIL